MLLACRLFKGHVHMLLMTVGALQSLLSSSGGAGSRLHESKARVKRNLVDQHVAISYDAPFAPFPMMACESELSQRLDVWVLRGVRQTFPKFCAVQLKGR